MTIRITTPTGTQWLSSSHTLTTEGTDSLWAIGSDHLGALLRLPGEPILLVAEDDNGPWCERCGAIDPYPTLVGPGQRPIDLCVDCMDLALENLEFVHLNSVE